MATSPTPGPTPGPDSKKEDQAETQLAVVQAQPPLIRIKKKLSNSAARRLKNGKYFPVKVSETYQSLVRRTASPAEAKPLIISYEEKPPKKANKKKKKIRYVDYNGVRIDREKFDDQYRRELKNYGITLPEPNS